MKTATLPPLRVEPELRKDVERLLTRGETLSAFIEEAIRESVDRRAADAAFAARALAGREASRTTGHYHSASSVLRDLRKLTRAARKSQPKRSR